MIRYAITDPAIFSLENATTDLRRIRSKGAEWICYRDKGNPRYDEDACRFVEAARAAGFGRIVLHGWIDLARRLGVWGIHLPSDAFERIGEAREADLAVIVSTHDLDEARRARDLGAHYATLSPLFASPGKGEPLGVERFARIARELEGFPLIALGGIVDDEAVARAMDAGAAGFASIRYFA
ncbi:thiamine phosphate synthase [Nitratifractor sp.]